MRFVEHPERRTKSEEDDGSDECQTRFRPQRLLRFSQVGSYQVALDNGLIGPVRDQLLKGSPNEHDDNRGAHKIPGPINELEFSSVASHCEDFA